jgi:peptide/nickel transport system substrate-binding protein
MIIGLWASVFDSTKEEEMNRKVNMSCFVNLGILVLMAVSLLGCKGNSQGPIQETQIPKTETPVETNIVIVIPEDPPSFNAMIEDTGYDALVMELVLQGLTDLDPQGNVIPELALNIPTVENGDVVYDEDAGTMDVTWRLRKDVKWQDGTPFNADDVIFTYEAISNPETGGWIPGIDYIESVDKIDDFTLVVHYSSVYPGYLTQFGGEQVVVWPKHYCNAEEGFSSWECARQPLSDGPYILDEWVAGDHMTFLKNQLYYQPGKPKIDKIIIKIVPDATVRKTMLIKGDADVYAWVTEPIAHDLSAESNVTVSLSPTNRWSMRLFPNLAAKGSIDSVANPHPILSDVRVRRAIRMAIDVDLISQEIFFGYGVPVWTEFFRPPYICDIPRPKYDPEGAKALLEEAGWIDINGDGVRECHGCLNAEEGYPMKMEMITYAEYGEALVLTQQLIAEMLGKIGIDFDLTVTEGSVLWADYASGGIEQRGNFDLDLYDDGYAGIDPTDFLYQYYYSASADPDAGWNIGRWINGDFDALLDESYTLDEAKRKELFCQMAVLLDQELPQILLFSTINADAYNNRLIGVQSSVNDMVTWNVADWTVNK